jgi:transcriptional regulator with XRE-family HTH domain
MGDVGTLGERVKELRQERDLGVRDFARRADISPAFVVDIEAGNRLPGSATLTRVANVLGTSLAELQALDPRLPLDEGEALRFALLGDWDEVMNMLGGLDDWRLERLQKAADMVDTAAGELLGRRHS